MGVLAASLTLIAVVARGPGCPSQVGAEVGKGDSADEFEDHSITDLI